MVDRSPTKLLQTAFVFYVKEGQRNALDILENAVKFFEILFFSEELWLNF